MVPQAPSNISKREALAQRAFLLWKLQKTFLFVPVQKEKVVCMKKRSKVFLFLAFDVKVKAVLR